MVDFNLKNTLRNPVHFQAESMTFGMFSKEEICKLSVVDIFNPAAFNQLGHPLDNGLYDLRMGPFTDRGHVTCKTCHLNAEYCPGHIGHINLPMPVINPLFYLNIHRVLKISCLHCHRFKMADCYKTQFCSQMKLLNLGLIHEAQEMGEIASRSAEGVEAGSGKKGKVDLGEAANLNIKLEQYFEEVMKRQIKLKTECASGNRTVESLRKDYIKQMWDKGKEPTCPRCGAITRKIIKTKTGFIYEGLRRDDDDGGEDEFQDFRSGFRKRNSRGEEKERMEINAQEMMDHFRALFVQDQELIENLFPVLSNTGQMKTPTDLFFIQVLAVPPPRARPAQITEGGMTMHPQTQGLQDVIHATITMKQLVKLIQGQEIEQFSKEVQEMLKTLKGATPGAQLSYIWKELQLAVDHVLDRNLNSTGNLENNNGWGLKQLIERKQGLFRMNMMGKRVNHACRTVITPDPNINIDEIGVPDVFAKKLSYPVPVTPWNVKELRRLIINGPNVHPGAVCIEDEFGKVILLDPDDDNQRMGIANTLLTPTYKNRRSQRPKIVYRHLRNGDAMLLNRQPTLHKPSIMGHKARVLKGEKVMRLHYSNCKSYNADFDGDEMNAHFPQSEPARSETYNIALSAHQYLGPKDGTPLQGLIQDHVIAGVKMTLRGRFFSRDQYLQLVYQALQGIKGKIKLQPPAILKPQQLWSGKQIMSTIIINLVPANKYPPNFASTAKIRPKLWRNGAVRPWKAGGSPFKNDIVMGESEVVVREGILCVGILDKNQYGATPYSLAHLLFELYGGNICTTWLSGLSILFTYFLQSIQGFTLGVEDILVRDDANQTRKDVMERTRLVGDECARQGVGAKGEVSKEELEFMMEEVHRASADTPRVRAELDRGYKEKLNPATNDINACCVPAGLIKPFPENNLQLMVNSGAKGSTVNTTQISCLLGQIELEGKRPPIMISGKSLPSFVPYDTQPRAGGFIDGRFMTGIQPPEFFFHCMAGREGLIDTACKTARSGYLQRCLIKLLEGLVVHHDFTVRDCDNTVVQFQYGEDSLDVCKSQYLKSSRLHDLDKNLKSVFNSEDCRKAKAVSNIEEIKEAKSEHKNWKKLENAGRTRRSPFLTFGECSTNIADKYQGYQKTKIGKEDPVMISRPAAYTHLYSEFRNLPKKIMNDLKESTRPEPPPLPSIHPPPVHFSAVTEVVDSMINDYLKTRPDGSSKADKKTFRDAMYTKVQQSCIAAGEPVGVLAAQSVGEPSTQMTLNTFHFAGRGEMNVTLGIPRLREILMVASPNIKTPSLSVPFREGVSQKEMDKFRLKFNRVLLSDLLEEVNVTEKVLLRPKRVRNVILRFKFIPHKYYKQDFGVNQSKVLAYMESKFFQKVFIPVMTAVSKEKKIGVTTATDNEFRAGGGGGDGDDDEKEGPQNKEKGKEEAADRAMGDMDSSDDEQENPGEEGTDVTKKLERQGDREYEELEEDDLKIKKEMDIRDENEDVDDPDDPDATLPDQKPPVAKHHQSGSDRKQDGGQQEDGLNYRDEAIGSDFEEEEDTVLQEELMSTGEPAKRRLHFLNNLEGACGLCQVSDYSFDTEKEQWCEVTLSFDISQKRMDMVNVIKKAAERGVIHQIKDIKKGFVIEKDGGYMLQTDGINVDVMYQYDRILDLNRLSCNNIHTMARYYGIESAYKTLIREVTNVFGVYGIVVDYRHLSLIADYMTLDGTYRPFNRVGIENNPSPLQQMTFETAMGFLRSATLGRKSDHLTSPSACIVLGKTPKGGTGSINLRYVM